MVGRLFVMCLPCCLNNVLKKVILIVILIMKTIIVETLVEWDDNKNRLNIKKHGISFETAALVFADEERIEYYDKLHSQNEDRFIVLGCVQGILFVVYTMHDEAVRIISARMATPLERRIYYGE